MTVVCHQPKQANQTHLTWELSWHIHSDLHIRCFYSWKNYTTRFYVFTFLFGAHSTGKLILQNVKLQSSFKKYAMAKNSNISYFMLKYINLFWYTFCKQCWKKRGCLYSTRTSHCLKIYHLKYWEYMETFSIAIRPCWLDTTFSLKYLPISRQWVLNVRVQRNGDSRFYLSFSQGLLWSIKAIIDRGILWPTSLSKLLGLKPYLDDTNWRTDQFSNHY